MARTASTIEIQPAALIWARERSGFDLPTASNKLDIKLDALVSMESGDIPLSPSQIRKISGLYRISPAALFLANTPTEQFEAPKDFRSLPDGAIGIFSPELRKEIDRARAQIAYMRELREMGIVAPRPVTLRVNRTERVEDVAGRIRGWCEDGHPPSSKIIRDLRDHLAWWIAAVERNGILVTQVSKVPFEEMRGFCLSDPEFPMIVLNGADSKSGRIFTLLHELVHLLLGVEGIINGFQSKNTTEVYCNAVAAAILIPKALLMETERARTADTTTWWSLEDLSVVSKEFGVSREAILRRLLTLGMTSQACFDEQQSALRAECKLSRESNKQSRGGPDHEIMLLRNLGRYYVSSVIRARERGAINEMVASDYLFSKVRWTDALERRLASERPK